jgi:protein phosphatase
MTASDLAETLKATIAEVRRPASVRIISDAQTDVGSVRDHNEDSLIAQELVRSNQGVSRPLGLYVVADGMGGHSAGEVASGIVINTLAQKMASEIMATQAGTSSPEVPDPEAWLQDSIAAANLAVFEQSKQTGNDMGTTVVAALLMGDTTYIGHVGDSRAYLLNAEGIRQLTIDHSLVERLIATNQITREEAQNHPQRNVIYRTIGDKSHVEVEVGKHRLAPGDRLLLCSDGLSGMVPDDEIWPIVMNSLSSPEACRQLIDAAKAAGGDDNITVIIVQVEAT